MQSESQQILYIMGIEWEWIFQRPQVLEQYLEEKYDVTVVFPRSILKWGKRKKKLNYPKKYHVLWTIPFQEKIGVIGAVSSWISRKIFQDVHKYNIVIIGFPLYYRYIPKSYKGKIIYDCMDNHESLYSDPISLKDLLFQEDILVRESNAIVVTAEKLKRKMESMSGNKKQKIYLIRNGTNLKICGFQESKADMKQNKRTYKLGYFGTISEWFDKGLLVESLNIFPDIEYHLIGPISGITIPNSKRIFKEGIVEHHQLPEVTKDYDCLIMPFVVNDVVEWVDPVKLYEYIALGKCIISIHYREVERFEEYVYMYDSHEEYIRLLKGLIKKGFPPKYNEKQQKEFLENNSWENRFQKWEMVLDMVLKTEDYTVEKEGTE